MKTLWRITCWLLVAAIIVWWQSGPTGFDARWVSLPPAMSWDMIDRARKASARPSFCMHHRVTGDGCRWQRVDKRPLAGKTGGHHPGGAPGGVGAGGGQVWSSGGCERGKWRVG